MKEGHTAFKLASLTTGKRKLEKDFSLESLLDSDVRMGDFAFLTLTILPGCTLASEKNAHD